MGGEYISDGLHFTISKWPISRGLPTQIIIVGDKRYVFIALNSESDEVYLEFIFKNNWKYVKEFSSKEPRPLDEITREICDTIRGKSAKETSSKMSILPHKAKNVNKLERIDKRKHFRHHLLLAYYRGDTASEVVDEIRAVYGPGTAFKSVAENWFERFFHSDLDLTVTDPLLEFEEGAFYVGPWLVDDPSDTAWRCISCESFFNERRSKICKLCDRPRLLTRKENAQTYRCKHMGEELRTRVIGGVYIGSGLNSDVDGIREFVNIPIQRLNIADKRYVFIGIRRDKDKDDLWDLWDILNRMREIVEYTFEEPRPLNEISQELCDVIQGKSKANPKFKVTVIDSIDS